MTKTHEKALVPLNVDFVAISPVISVLMDNRAYYTFF